MRCITLLLIFVLGTLVISTNVESAEPEQVHLATNGIPGEMVVQWGTEEDTTAFCNSDNTVEYGTSQDSLNFSEEGDDDMYLWTTCTHTTILSGLTSNTTYYYRVGGSGEWSDIFSFKTMEENPENTTGETTVVSEEE